MMVWKREFYVGFLLRRDLLHCQHCRIQVHEAFVVDDKKVHASIAVILFLKLRKKMRKIRNQKKIYSGYRIKKEISIT